MYFSTYKILNRECPYFQIIKFHFIIISLIFIRVGVQAYILTIEASVH